MTIDLATLMTDFEDVAGDMATAFDSEDTAVQRQMLDAVRDGLKGLVDDVDTAIQELEDK